MESHTPTIDFNDRGAKGAVYYSRALLSVSCSFIDPFSLKLTFEDAFLVSSCQSGTELFFFAFVSKWRKEFQTMLSAIIPVFQNHP